jgi:hypothetical protein
MSFRLADASLASFRWCHPRQPCLGYRFLWGTGAVDDQRRLADMCIPFVRRPADPSIDSTARRDRSGSPVHRALVPVKGRPHTADGSVVRVDWMTRRVRRTLVLPILSASSISLVSLAILVGSGRVPGTQPVGTSIRLGIGSAIMVFASYKAFRGWLFATSWWNAIDKELSRRGFRPATAVEGAHTAGIRVQLLSPTVVRMDRGGGIDHVMVGVIDGSEVRTSRARIRGGYHWIDSPAAAMRLPLSLAPTTIRRVHSGVRPLGLKRACFELGAFDRTVDVRTADPYVASALVGRQDDRVVGRSPPPRRHRGGRRLGGRVVDLAPRSDSIPAGSPGSARSLQ